MTIGIDIEGLDDVLELLVRLPSEAMPAIERAAGRYLRDRLQKYPKPQKSIRRRVAFPETGDGFFTEKQRRWFWWALRSGRLQLPYRRTGRLRQNWKLIPEPGAILINETPYSVYTQGAGTQSRQMVLGGWKNIDEVIAESRAGVNAAIESEAARVIKKLDR